MCCDVVLCVVVVVFFFDFVKFGGFVCCQVCLLFVFFYFVFMSQYFLVLFCRIFLFVVLVVVVVLFFGVCGGGDDVMLVLIGDVVFVVQMFVKLNVQFDDVVMVDVIVLVMIDVGFMWVLLMVLVVQIGVIVVYSFGNCLNVVSGNMLSIGGNQFVLFDLGFVNEVFVDVVYCICQLKLVKVYVQWEIVCFFVLKYGLGVDVLLLIELVIVSDGLIVYLSIVGVVVVVVLCVGGVVVMGIVVVVGYCDYVKCCIQILWQVGMQVVVVVEVLLLIMYDLQLGQLWMCNCSFYFVYDMYVQMLMYVMIVMMQVFLKG